MNQSEVLFEREGHKVVKLRLEIEEDAYNCIDTNQYLIISGGEGILLDSGGRISFADIYDECLKYIKSDDLKYIILSHQDPDVCSSICDWLAITPARVIISKHWYRFILQLGSMDFRKFISIDDCGYELKLKNGRVIKILPAHFLHSVANFSVYDETSKILFSGDVCSSVIDEESYEKVENFAKHQKYMQDFHERYMCSNIALKKWVSMASKLDINLIAPQHGAMFAKDNIKPLFNWLKELNCGLDNIDKLYETTLV